MKKYLPLFIVLLFILSACQNNLKKPEVNTDEQEKAVETSSGKNKVIEVPLKNQDNVELGIATLTEKNDGVEIKVQASHLETGIHGIHIHEKGICTAPDFDSAGGHFNPADQNHGFEHEKGPHAGDIENLQVDENGTVNQTFFNEYVTLEEGKPNSLANEQGTALVIHEKEDDYISQPSGDSGDRIVCGVIAQPQGKKSTSKANNKAKAVIF